MNIILLLKSCKYKFNIQFLNYDNCFRKKMYDGGGASSVLDRTNF